MFELNQKSLSRPRCQQCYRPESHCLCAHISVLDNHTRVLVLQHTSEQKHALNTGRLAVLGLQHAELLVGEHFPQLDAIVAETESVFLLFPGQAALAPQTARVGLAGQPALIIVPDGTWRKARKILHANPVLNTLPRLSLDAGEPSTYRIRRTRQPDAVSTIEAIVRTLTVLEPDKDFSPLLRPFDVLIEQQIQAMGEGVYRRHYG